jgi:hypothetical protein
LIEQSTDGSLCVLFAAFDRPRTSEGRIKFCSATRRIKLAKSSTILHRAWASHHTISAASDCEIRNTFNQEIHDPDLPRHSLQVSSKLGAVCPSLRNRAHGI